MKYLKGYDMFKAVQNYYPIILNINYTKENKLFAFVNYGVFTKDAKNQINGIKIIK